MGASAGHGGHDRAFGSVVGAALAALALLLGPLTLAGGPTPDPGPAPLELVATAARDYLDAWERGDLEAMRSLVAATPPDFDSLHTGFTDGLGVRGIRLRHGAPEVMGSTASVPFAASVDVGGLGTWDYDGRLDLVFAAPVPSGVDVQPMAEGSGGAESPRVGRPAPTPVDALSPRWAVAWSPSSLHPALVPGTVLARRREAAPRAPLVGVGGVPLTGAGAPRLPALGAQVLGSVAVIDEAGARSLGSWYQAGDVVGISGLQAAADTRLSGRPSGAVELVDGAGEVVEVLHVFPGEAPAPVATTFDPEIQVAAEAALSGTSKAAALVVVDAPTGEVRAVANRPAAGFNRALLGQYPPGSTFKVVTATALLESGVTPETIVSCPAAVSIGGFRFSNAGGEALGDIPFRTAFFRSCNTAFVQLAEELDAGELTAAAERFGFNAELALPVPATAGTFPAPATPVDKAAAAIGQAQVTASPLQMATVAAAVASGTWRPPRMLAAPEAPRGQALPEAVVATLRDLMRRVVDEGTGTAARLPGEPVGGKTGTAEYGGARPPRTHAWFIGFRGDLAFALVVEDGGFGGAVAAPLARSFLAGLG